MTTGAAEGRVETPGANPEVGGRKPSVDGDGAASVTGMTDNPIPEAERLMEEIVSRGNMMAAYSKVVANKGAPGVYKIPVTELKGYLQEHWPRIKEELLAGRYVPLPVLRVEIPKPAGGTRILGIPVIMDRIVSQSVNMAFEEIFDPEFTGSNYGFRRGKSQHQAIRHVQELVEQGYEWCASIDLQSFFDEIPFDLILKLIRRRISDERLVTLIARALKAGVIEDGVLVKTTKGCPQGSPLSPMLSNIVLNELDHELEKRGLTYCRWADDFLVLVKSERAANRVMEGVTHYLEERLGLPVNREKSKVSKIKDATFLSFQILMGKIRVSNKARTKFKKRVRDLTIRNNPLSMFQITQELNEYLRGWVSYFKIQEFKRIFYDLDAWIRSRLRSMQLKKWKKPKKFQRKMIGTGYSPDEAHDVWVKMNRWKSVERKEVRFVMNLEWFGAKGLVFTQ
jgi:group II intron reverse transcriptase/maturase